MIDDTDKKIISAIQGDLPLLVTPFEALAEKIGIPEERLIARIKGLKEAGIIRRFGATLKHQEAGFSSNAMIAWRVPDEWIDDIGIRLAQFREVTHCYHRSPQRDWPYNLYTMVHGASREECREIAERLSRTAAVHDYLLLFSEKEFKKTSMAYFSENHENESI